VNALVLGIGNILLRDEGVGVRVVESMAKRYTLPEEVEILDGGTSGMDLLYTISGRDLLIVCDAVKADAPPGTIIPITGDDVPVFLQAKLSPHQVGLSDVLATLKLLDELPPVVSIIGIVPEDLSLGTELSPTAAGAVDRALTMIVDELVAAGIDIGPQSLPATEVA
jgi:hydrogenase maturation protease